MDIKLMRQKIDNILDHNPFSKVIGLELLEIDEGYAKGRIKFAPNFKNVHGGLHGGCSYALGDTLSGVASSTFGNYTTTINGSINYLKAIRDTEYVYGESRVVRQGGTIGVYNVNITNDAGEVLATGTYTYYRTSTPIE